ncbi:alpha/beta fold hydrolase [Nonomuraea sp. SBT364]|uniref:alpha/beta fold hydrolase n=1 Tax=Nonomuraea sp. SBT364 TaxID=1580530 RepID=UPI00066A691D|nr:alpha/beta hydrolase [Nonomuraea sp. SBT364]
MTTFALIHGGGGCAWHWHLLEDELRRRGHRTVAVDLPIEDPEAGLGDYADAVAGAIGERAGRLVVVAHSWGGFVGPLVCDRVEADLLVMLAAMVPVPGEPPSDWWGNTGFGDKDIDDEVALFMHDVPPGLAAEVSRRGRGHAEKALAEPWPLERWPDVPTRFLLCRDDRWFPPEFMRATARARLGVTADEIDGSHSVMLSRPAALADRLEAYDRDAG